MTLTIAPEPPTDDTDTEQTNEVFELLIANGCDVNQVQGEGWTALRMYLYKQKDNFNPAVLQLFIDAGFNTKLLPLEDFASYFVHY